MVVARFIRFYPGYTLRDVLDMPVKHFALLNESIEKITEVESAIEVQRLIYAQSDEKSRKQLAKNLFPSQEGKAEYTQYDDKGEGIRRLKMIAHR